MTEILGSGSREIAVVVVPESVEGRDAVVAQIEEAGAMAVTEAQLEAMQQQVADTAPQPQTEYELRLPEPRELSPRESLRVDRLHAERCLSPSWRWQISPADDRAEAERMAAADAKRARKALRSLRCQGGR